MTKPFVMPTALPYVPLTGAEEEAFRAAPLTPGAVLPGRGEGRKGAAGPSYSELELQAARMVRCRIVVSWMQTGLPDNIIRAALLWASKAENYAQMRKDYQFE